LKSLDDLKQFYNEQLIGDLQLLEAKRKKTLHKMTITAATAFAIALILGVFLGGGMRSCFGIFILIMLALVVTGLINYRTIKQYTNDFKGTVISRIVKFLDENLNYEPSGFIDKNVFMTSKIFKTTPNKYKGDDLVWGNVGATKIRFSELNAVYESGTGKDRHEQTIFKGLFFIADFNKNFKGSTVVLPDAAETLLGRLGTKLQSMNILRGQLIKLEDPQFEKEFVVYGDDQVEARYILSPSLMSRIVDYKQKTGKRIYLSFVGSTIFVAIWIGRNLFEPRIFKTLLDFEPIRQYYEDLKIAIEIVEDLNLNVRIWSKE
jgi:hypothetical protein